MEFYSRPKDIEATWPPSPSEKFINLAVINREKVSTEELHRFMLATLDKGVDTILETKAPVEIEQLMDTKQGVRQQCILVEGAPGVGKTTLSWEICKRWGEGKLFKQFSLMLLLRLRDETVQTAATFKDLVLYPYEERLEAITQYLKDTNGKNTLILLEGLDELPQHLLTQPTIFTRLLAGKDLPGATILVTSRPSATAQLWKKWKERISRHIEILGFTEDNITAYIASILSPKEIPDFDTYLSTAPSIRQLMYIPLHSGIVIEIYRTCRGSDKPLPTNKTTLYTALIQTILTRYLAKHPKYTDDEIDIEQFTDLPGDVYTDFMDITKLAYESVCRQQQIFKDKDKPIQHLGLMDVVAELFPNKRRMRYSYNFLHLSIQEYLGAVYMSLMDTSTQEQLLRSMCIKRHLKNMAMFLAGITKFKGMNLDLVKQAIRREIKEEEKKVEEARREENEKEEEEEEEVEEEEEEEDQSQLTLSPYTLRMVYETENISLLEGYWLYTYKLSQYSPSFDFTALGYCMASSRDKWSLQLGDGNNRDYIQTTSGVDLLLHALHSRSNSKYTINSIDCNHKETEIAQRLLVGLPCHTLPLVETLGLVSETLKPLPACLPGFVSTMSKLNALALYRATAATLADTLQALATAPTHTLVRLDLTYSQFNLPAMEALSALLEHSKSLAVLGLVVCGLTDDLVCVLATGLHHRLPALGAVDLRGNPLVGDRGRAALDECTTTNKEMELDY